MKQLSKSEIKLINEQVSNLNIEISKKDEVKEDKNVILVNNIPWFFILDGKYYPTLRLELIKSILKKITIDMGAVKFIASGADVMRPGITDIQDGIKKEEIVSIVDSNHKKPLAIGRALFEAEEIKSLTSGKVIKNLHYVGDDIWKYETKHL
jgi:PUA-domain protein